MVQVSFIAHLKNYQNRPYFDPKKDTPSPAPPKAHSQSNPIKNPTYFPHFGEKTSKSLIMWHSSHANSSRKYIVVVVVNQYSTEKWFI
jgi:hypothetical protein